MVRTSVHVFFVIIAELLSTICCQRDGNQEEDEWPANATSVRNHDLRVSLEHHNDNNWDSEDDRPDTFDATLVIIEEELAATPLTDPALDGHDLHKVVSESDR